MIVPSGKRKYQVSQGYCKNQSIFDDDIFERLTITEEKENRSPEQIEKDAQELNKIKDALNSSNSKSIKSALALNDPGVETEDSEAPRVPEDLLGVPDEVRPGMPSHKDRGSVLTRSIDPGAQKEQVIQPGSESNPGINTEKQEGQEGVQPIDLDQDIKIKVENAAKAVDEIPALDKITISGDEVSISKQTMEEQAKAQQTMEEQAKKPVQYPGK